MPHRDTARTSLLSLGLLIFGAGVVSAAPIPTLKSLEISEPQIAEAPPILILAQDPQNTGSQPPAPGTRDSTEPISLWLLGFIVLGLPFLLFWLRSLRGTKTVGKSSILILTPEPGESGRVYWEVSQQKIEALQRQGGKQMMVRLMDVTDINPQITDPAIVAQAKCSPLVNLLSIPIPQLDREYQAELGYLTTDEHWLPLVKSAPTYFAAPKSLFGNLGSPSPTIVTAVGNLDLTPPSVAPATSPTKPPAVSPAIPAPTPVTPTPATSLETPPVEIAEETQETEATLAGAVTQEISETSEISEVSIDDPWATPNTPDSLEQSTSEQSTIVTTTLPTPVPTPFESELDREVVLPVVAEELPEEVNDQVVAIETPIPEVSPLASESIPDLTLESTPESTASATDVAEIIPDTTEAIPVIPENLELIDPPPTSISDLAPPLIPDQETAIDPVTSIPSVDVIEPEVTTTIPPVVPTIDDGESNLNWGVASAVVSEITPELSAETTPEAISTTSLEVIPESTPELIPETIPEIDSAVITEPEPEVLPLPLIETQINLTTPEAGKIQVNWDIEPTEVENCKAQGGKDFGLRIYDATDIDISAVAPHSTHEYSCDEASRELVISAPLGDRIYGDYIAELGYLTETREWIPVIRSFHIRIVR